MTRIILAALALACAFSNPVFAQAVGDPAANNSVILPYGEWIVAAANTLVAVLLPLLVAIITRAIYQVAPWLRLLISDQLVEASLRKWLDYALNEVAGATKDGALSVPVGSAVLAKAIQRGIDRADVSKIGDMVMKAAGGPQEAAAKLFRMLRLEEGASAVAVLAPVQSMLPAK